MFTQTLAIIRNTFTESIRQPFFVVMLLLGVLLAVLNLGLSGWTLGEDDKLLTDLGMSNLLLLGLFLAAFTAAGVVSREIENKTVLTVISKPIGRPLFVIGKYIGVAAAIALAYWVWALAYLMTLRHGVMSTASDHIDQPVAVFGLGALAVAVIIAVAGNFLYRKVFASTLAYWLAATMTVGYLLVLMVDKDWSFQAPIYDLPGQVILALFLVLQAVWVLTAVAVAASTRLGMVMTLGVCLVVFFLGLLSDAMFGRFADDNIWARLSYPLPPNVQFHWLADALTQDTLLRMAIERPAAVAEYVGLVSAYSALYITAVLCLGIALFQTRETS